MAGGALGVAARAAISTPFAPDAQTLVTLAINVLGSFALGVVVGLWADRHPLARLFWGTGVLGGFTTYSAFALQVWSEGAESLVLASALAVGSIVGGVAAAALGLSAGRRLHPTRSEGAA